MTDHETSIPIDHSQITDGFADLSSHQFYRSLSTYCGICDRPITLSPLEQKYLLEKNSVLVKIVRRGPAFSGEGVKRRARIKLLRAGEHWRSQEGGKEELDRLV